MELAVDILDLVGSCGLLDPLGIAVFVVLAGLGIRVKIFSPFIWMLRSWLELFSVMILSSCPAIQQDSCLVDGPLITCVLTAVKYHSAEDRAGVEWKA
jgi:hypothetical protein